MYQSSLTIQRIIVQIILTDTFLSALYCHAGMEPRHNLLPCSPAGIPYMSEKKIKAGTCLNHGTPDNIGVSAFCVTAGIQSRTLNL